MPNYRIPDADALNAMIGMIVDPDTAAELHDSPQEFDASYVALFVDGSDQLVAQCACDLALAASVGCALSMIPPNTASDMAKSGALTEMAEGNLYEVMNMFSSLFMDDNSDHLRLTQVVPATEAPALDGEVKKAVFTLAGGKYQGGKLSFTSH